MMAVADEIEAARLVDRDRWHGSGGEGLAKGLESLLEITARLRPEEAVVVHRAVNRADDLVNRDLAHAEVALADHVQTTRDFVERQQRVRRHRADYTLGQPVIRR